MKKYYYLFILTLYLILSGCESMDYTQSDEQDIPNLTQPMLNPQQQRQQQQQQNKNYNPQQRYNQQRQQRQQQRQQQQLQQQRQLQEPTNTNCHKVGQTTHCHY